ncbi:MAG: hypothetical protein ACOY5V_05495 [Pseudomonadota bacterium]
MKPGDDGAGTSAAPTAAVGAYASGWAHDLLADACGGDFARMTR